MPRPFATLLASLAFLTVAAAPPNIIVILVDDMGFSVLGCYGSEIPTPNLDALAKNGLRFTQFYNTGRCCPTRASILTGLLPATHGVSDNGIDLPDATGEAGDDDLQRAVIVSDSAIRVNGGGGGAGGDGGERDAHATLLLEGEFVGGDFGHGHAADGAGARLGADEVYHGAGPALARGGGDGGGVRLGGGE